MRTTALLICLLALPVAAATTPQAYRCLHIGQGAQGERVVDRDQYVDLSYERGEARTLIHVNSANRDLRFDSCVKTADDGSNFHGWFETECRKLVAAEGKGFSADPFMIGAYAGISPPVMPGYSMYDALAQAGAALGLGTPARTVVIYSGRKPQYDFFCYPAAEPAK